MLSNTEFLLMSHQIRKLYSQLLAPVADAYQLTQVEIDVLLFLHNNPQYDTARDIAEYRMIAKSYVSKAVELLIQKGYLCAQPDSSDKRTYHLYTQDSAKAALGAALAAQQHFAAILHKGLTAEQKESFKQSLTLIYQNIQEVLSNA